MTWLTTQKAAELVQVHESTIRRKMGGFIFRSIKGVGGKSGIQYEIALESLPREAQDRYHGIHREKNCEVLLSLTETQRNEVSYKHNVVLSYLNFKKAYLRTDKLEAFLTQHNAENPDRTVTRRQLISWAKAYKLEGAAGLVDRRGGYKKGVIDIPQDVKDVFLNFWLNENSPSVASCYRLTLLVFPDKELPGVRTFQRFANSIPIYAQTYHREGKKAFDDKHMPYLAFDYRSIYSNRQWVADNHKFDVMVRFPNGSIGRPWLIGWMDRRSRAIVGHLVTDHDPNADAILDSFARAVHAYGVPENVLLDNGKDYTVHDLFTNDVDYSLANFMRVLVTNTTPYNAKAKPIERFFRTLEETYCKMLDSYVGSDAKKRPKGIEEKAIPFDEFVDFIGIAIEDYNNTPHGGEAMDGLTPRQAWHENKAGGIRKANNDLLALYFKRTARPVKVGRNGINVPELAQRYDADELWEYYGKKVYARYNTDNVKQVYCFDEEMKFICIAESRELANLDPEITAQNIRKLNAEKKRYRKASREHKPDIEMPPIEMLLQDSIQAKQANAPIEKPMQNDDAIIMFNMPQQMQAEAVKLAEKTKQANENKKNAGQFIRRENMDAFYNHMTGTGG